MIARLVLAVGLIAAQLAPAVFASDDVPPCPTRAEIVGVTAAESEVRWITSLRVALMASTPELRGRRISLRDTPVRQVDGDGFWIGADTDACRLYVKPAEGKLIQVQIGELIDLQGEFRFTAQQGSPDDGNPYVYAYIVRRAPENLVKTPLDSTARPVVSR